MKLPAGQHPSRPVDVKSLLDDNSCHSPPHRVRLKPLSRNTEQRNTYELERTDHMEQAIEQEDKEVEVGRTFFHIEHPTRDPL